MWNARASNGGSVPLRADIKGTELPPANILIPLERQLIALQLCTRVDRRVHVYTVVSCTCTGAVYTIGGAKQ